MGNTNTTCEIEKLNANFDNNFTTHHKTSEDVLANNILNVIDSTLGMKTNYTSKQAKLIKELAHFTETINSILNDNDLNEQQKSIFENVLAASLVTAVCDISNNHMLSKQIDYTQLFGSYVDFKNLTRSVITKIKNNTPNCNHTKLQEYAAKL